MAHSTHATTQNTYMTMSKVDHVTMIRTIDFHFAKIRPLYLSQTHHQSLKSLQCYSYNANQIAQIYLASSNLK